MSAMSFLPGEKNELAALRVWERELERDGYRLAPMPTRPFASILRNAGALDRQAPLLVCRYRGQLRRMSRRGLPRALQAIGSARVSATHSPGTPI